MSGSLVQLTKMASSVFYHQPKEVVHSGYLHKSPPKGRLKVLRTWKRRYFVLFKMSEDTYELMYFKSHEKKDKPLGKINLYQVSLMFFIPEKQAMWEWIQRSFRCPASCVLFLNTAEREYFLIGENSGEVDSWFNVLFKALQTRPHRLLTVEECRKIRAKSEPVAGSFSYGDEQSGAERKQKTEARRSAPELHTVPEESLYDYPRKYSASTLKSEEEDGTDDDEVDEEHIDNDLMKDENGETDSCHYVDMSQVREIVNLRPPNSLHTKDNGMPSTKDSPLDHVTLAFGDLWTGMVFGKQSLDTDNVSMETEINCSAGLDQQNVGCLHESETVSPKEKDIIVSQVDLKNNLILKEDAGKPCVSDWTKQFDYHCLFHRGDQILAINDLHTDSVEEVHTYLGKLCKNEVKLTIGRRPGSQPLHLDPCTCD